MRSIGKVARWWNMRRSMAPLGAGASPPGALAGVAPVHVGVGGALVMEHSPGGA